MICPITSTQCNCTDTTCIQRGAMGPPPAETPVSASDSNTKPSAASLTELTKNLETAMAEFDTAEIEFNDSTRAYGRATAKLTSAKDAVNRARKALTEMIDRKVPT
jgi:exonuclease VII small subunit